MLLPVPVPAERDDVQDEGARLGLGVILRQLDLPEAGTVIVAPDMDDGVGSANQRHAACRVPPDLIS